MVLLSLACLLPSAGASSAGVSIAQGPNFQTEIQPVISRHCFACHGPDQAARKAGLRLDTHEGALAPLEDGLFTIQPGDRSKSQLWHRISSADSKVRMPPASTKDSLTEAEIELLGAWIDAGANWQEHWAWVAPIKAELPQVQNKDWPRNAIDHFILAKLEGNDMAPSPEADRATLLRRLALDLTGLPATLEERAAFLADDSPDAYEKVVDRLLASPRYGEHLSRIWLDAARYGDTHGLHLDNRRSMWPWRDWVVKAYNQNMPFDQFVMEQIAGDLLPDATQDQKIASGFNRCNPTSAEGGMITAEYLSIYAKDRTETTAVVMLGVSLGCAQCHDHKYDPFSMKDYYSMMGFFNSIAESATDQNIPNPAPFIQVASEEQALEMERLEILAKELSEKLDGPLEAIDASQKEWEQSWTKKLLTRWLILSPYSATAENGTQLDIRNDQSILARGSNPHKEVFTIESSCPDEHLIGLRLEALAHESLIGGLPGRATNGNFVMTGFSIEVAPRTDPEAPWQPVDIVTTNAQWSQTNGYPIEDSVDGKANTGWGGLGRGGNRDCMFIASEPFGFTGGTRLRVRMEFNSPHKQHTIGHFRLAISSDESLLRPEMGPWSLSSNHPLSGAKTDEDATHPFMGGVDLGGTDGEGTALWTPMPNLADNQTHGLPGAIGSYYLHRTLSVPGPRTFEIGLGSDDGVRLFLDGRRVFAKAVPRGVGLDQDIFTLNVAKGDRELLLEINNYGGACGFAWRMTELPPSPLDPAQELTLASPPSERGPEEKAELRDIFRHRNAPEWVAMQDERDETLKARTTLKTALPTTMVSQDLATARPTRILMRGAYDRPGETVQPATPASLPPMEKGSPPNRLGLAQWLVKDENPLVARVVVNRHWQRIFGTGIVKTSEDFGTQGERPIHPELLDWLAVELHGTDWDLQALQRMIVTSSTYRQAAAVTPEQLAMDPENRLLARGARFRLDGEVLRDQALLVSGLFVPKVGGPPVNPYQPQGLWKAVGYSRSNTVNFRQDKGEANYRRSLYTFWKRTSAPPNLAIFDAPSRESTCVRRERTNTPMQALALLNDPQFVEFSRGFAQRILDEGGESDASKVDFGFMCLTLREPDGEESKLLVDLLQEARAHFVADPSGTAALLKVGATPLTDPDNAPEIAAWTILASTLFSLDEVITRG